MSWDRVDEDKRTSGRRELTFVTWRCSGCRKMAVTTGESPGKCLWRPCRYYAGAD